MEVVEVDPARRRPWVLCPIEIQLNYATQDALPNTLTINPHRITDIIHNRHLAKAVRQP